MAHKFNMEAKARNEGWLGRGTEALFNLPNKQKWTNSNDKECSSTSSHRLHNEWLVGPEASTERNTKNQGEIAFLRVSRKPTKEPIKIEGYNSTIKNNPFLKGEKRNLMD
jgi:hypothetical protein